MAIALMLKDGVSKTSGSKFSIERIFEFAEELFKLCVEAHFVVEVLTRNKFAPRVEFSFYDLPEV